MEGMEAQWPVIPKKTVCILIGCKEPMTSHDVTWEKNGLVALVIKKTKWITTVNIQCHIASTYCHYSSQPSEDVYFIFSPFYHLKNRVLSPSFVCSDISGEYNH